MSILIIGILGMRSAAATARRMVTKSPASPQSLVNQGATLTGKAD